MLRTLLTSCFLLTTLFLLTTCCGSVSCNCQDQNDDALFLRFDATDFTAAELKRVYILRTILRDTARKPRVDTAVFAVARPNLTDSIVIRTDRPFAPIANRKLGAYRYQIFTPDKTTVNHVIDSVSISGELRGDGCCTCYDNTKKILYFDGKPYDLTDPTERDAPQYFIIRR